MKNKKTMENTKNEINELAVIRTHSEALRSELSECSPEQRQRIMDEICYEVFRGPSSGAVVEGQFNLAFMVKNKE